MKDVASLNVSDCEVEGLLQFGIESNDRKRKKLAKLSMNLDPNFVVIAHNEKPSLGKSFMGFGMAAVGLLIAGFGGSKKSAPPPLPPLPTA